MHVVAPARTGAGSVAVRQQGQVFGQRYFTIGRVAFHHGHRMAAAFHKRGVVRDFPSFGLGPAVGFGQRRRPKCLRSLRGPQIGAGRSAPDTVPGIHFLDGVGDGQAGHDAERKRRSVRRGDGRRVGQGVGHTGDQGRGKEGTGSVVHQNRAAGGGQGGQTQSHRILTAGTSGGRAPRHAQDVITVKIGQFGRGGVQPFRRKHDDQPSHPGRGGQGAGGPPPQGRAVPAQELLGLAARGGGQPAALTGGQQQGPALVVHGVPRAAGAVPRRKKNRESDCKPGFVPFVPRGGRRSSFL